MSWPTQGAGGYWLGNREQVPGPLRERVEFLKVCHCLQQNYSAGLFFGLGPRWPGGRGGNLGTMAPMPHGLTICSKIEIQSNPWSIGPIGPGFLDSFYLFDKKS